MRIVLDTNILIDGLKDEYSYERRILREVAEDHLEAFANRKTLQENRLILHQLTENGGEELKGFFDKLQTVSSGQRLNVVRDREDNKILESAITAKADFLITGDNDLLRMEEYEGIKIVNASEFWAQYKDEGKDLWTQWTKFINKKE